jgi:polar amino acid transport system permease protein
LLADQEASPRLADVPEVRAEPVRHPGNWIGALVVLVLAAMLGHTLVVNRNFHWDVVGSYFLSGEILGGLLRTLELTVLAMVIGVCLGTVLAVMRASRNLILSGAAALYIWFFRGTPLLVQLIFWFNISSLYPRLSLGVPFGPILVSGSSNALISAFTAALLGLGLNQAAYTAEIVRAGILSVPVGQLDAAASLGMSSLMTMRRVVLPQAMRVIIPPLGNETIGMLKTTSIVSVLAMPELLYSAQLVYARTYQTMPLLIVASLWYLLVTTALTSVQLRIERHFARGAGTGPVGTLHEFGRRVFAHHARFRPPAPAGAALPGGR